VSVRAAPPRTLLRTGEAGEPRTTMMFRTASSSRGCLVFMKKWICRRVRKAMTYFCLDLCCSMKVCHITKRLTCAFSLARGLALVFSLPQMIYFKTEIPVPDSPCLCLNNNTDWLITTLNPTSTATFVSLLNGQESCFRCDIPP
jgi:hypothetical protein